MNKRIRILNFRVEFTIVTSKLETENFSSECYAANPEIMFAYKIDPTNKKKPQFRK